MTVVLSAREAIDKHRLASGPPYAIDFGRTQLPSGVTLTGTPSIAVTKEAAGPDTDMSSEFTPGSVQIQDGAISGRTDAQVAFSLPAAASGEQDGGEYVLRVQATGSDGLTYQSVHRLTVYETGDTTAP